MLNEEEKNAIEYIKEFKNEVFEGVGNKSIMAKNIDILLNLINKQQKEIEYLKAITQNYNVIGGETFGDDRIIVCSMKYFYNGYFKKNYIFKDKIREKIKEYQEKAEDVKQKYKGVYAYKDDYLEALAKIEGYQELLEEN